MSFSSQTTTPIWWLGWFCVEWGRLIRVAPLFDFCAELQYTIIGP
jgi:hypothetical protein